jgi:transposase
MESVSIIGLDLAKGIFQAHGNDERGAKQFSKKLRRGEVLAFFAKQSPTVVAMEACSSSHYWGREIAALGHEVKLIPAQHVKPFVKRAKNDAADAEAICEAAVRPNMRFVAVKTSDQHSLAMVFRTRDLLVRQRTQWINAVRGHCAEFGIIAPVGNAGYEKLKVAIVPDKVGEVSQKEGQKDRLGSLADARDPMAALNQLARDMLVKMVEAVTFLDNQVVTLDKVINALAKKDDGLAALKTIPGVGPITALAIKALGPDPKLFASGRDYAAWMGLVPSQHSSGGKERLGKITKKGNRTLRRLLVICAGAQITSVMRSRSEPDPWLKGMLARHPRMKVITALANKLARIIWAMQVKGGVYQVPTPIQESPSA